MIKTLQELKDSNIIPCSVQSLGIKLSGEKKDWAEEKINEYLSDFVFSEKCLGCEHDMTGILGMFQWGIQHGEGNCSNCGYPARAYHRVPDVVNWQNMVLQYHPKTLTEKTTCQKIS